MAKLKMSKKWSNSIKIEIEIIYFWGIVESEIVWLQVLFSFSPNFLHKMSKIKNYEKFSICAWIFKESPFLPMIVKVILYIGNLSNGILTTWCMIILSVF